MDGDLLALGAMGVLAAAGLARRGSRNDELATGQPVILGYHCSQRQIRGRFNGTIARSDPMLEVSQYWLNTLRDFHDSLPYGVQDPEFASDLWARREMGMYHQGWPEGDHRDHPGTLDDDGYADAMERWFSEHGVGVIYVSSKPLSDAGSHGRSRFGDWCYQVSIDPRGLLSYEDDSVNVAGADANAVLYRSGLVVPILTEINLDDIDVDHPEVEFPVDAPFGVYEPRPTLGGMGWSKISAG